MASTLSLPPIQTSLPLPAQSHSQQDDGLSAATPKDARSSSFMQASGQQHQPQNSEPERGMDDGACMIKREEYPFAENKPTPDLLSPNTAFSQAAAQAQAAAAAASASALGAGTNTTASFVGGYSMPQASYAQQAPNAAQLSQSYPGTTQSQQQQPYTATPGGYYPNPYYTGPTAPWAYTLQPPSSASTQSPAAPPPPQQQGPPHPAQASYLPAAQQAPPQNQQDYLAFSQAAAAASSLYNPALYGMHPWSYADLVSSGFNYSAGLMRPAQGPASMPSMPHHLSGNLSSSTLTDFTTSDSDFSASDATTSSRKSNGAPRKIRSSSSNSVLSNHHSYSSSQTHPHHPPPAAAGPVQSHHHHQSHSNAPSPAPRAYHSAHHSGNNNNNSNLNKEKKYICAHCGEAFARNFNLKSHISCKHMGEKPFSCNCCAKTFSRKHDTARHLAARHGYSHAEATAEVNKRYPVGAATQSSGGGGGGGNGPPGPDQGDNLANMSGAPGMVPSA